MKRYEQALQAGEQTESKMEAERIPEACKAVLDIFGVASVEELKQGVQAKKEEYQVAIARNKALRKKSLQEWKQGLKVCENTLANTSKAKIETASAAQAILGDLGVDSVQALKQKIDTKRLAYEHAPARFKQKRRESHERWEQAFQAYKEALLSTRTQADDEMIPEEAKKSWKNLESNPCRN